jgi:carboxymethylenebutenolidase
MIDIEADDGRTFEAYLAVPKRVPAPGLLVLPEMFNSNTAMRALTDAYAEEGLVAIAPDMYWRTGARQYFEYSRENSPPAKALYNALDRDAAVADMGRCITTLRTRSDVNGKVGIVGFCMGGEIGLLAGCRLSVDAIAAYYATQLNRHLKELASLRPPTLLHFADKDPHVPLDVVQSVQAAVVGLAHVSLHIYPNTEHAFARPNHPTFNAAVTALAAERTRTLFEVLRPRIVQPSL